MLRLVFETERERADVIEEAREYFGGAFGLNESASEATVTFAGAGGYITLELAPRPEGGTTVEIVTDEFEQQAREFGDQLE